MSKWLKEFDDDNHPHHVVRPVTTKENDSNEGEDRAPIGADDMMVIKGPHL